MALQLMTIAAISVSQAGDLNGDGIDDIIIGAYLADPSGREKLDRPTSSLGVKPPFPASFELSSLDGTNGFILNGIKEGDYSGYSVSQGRRSQWRWNR